MISVNLLRRACTVCRMVKRYTELPRRKGEYKPSSWCRDCHNDSTLSRFRKRWQSPEFRTAHRNRMYGNEQRRKKEFLEAFGGRCQRCGFDDTRALQLDHVNGGGSRQRKRMATHAIRQDALNNRSDYQLLCANCNWIKRFERGEHRQRIVEETYRHA